MRLQASAGRRTDAMATYSRLAEALKRDLELVPEPLTRSLYAELLAGTLSPAARSPDQAASAALAPAQPALDLPAPPEGGLVGRAHLLGTLLTLAQRAGAGHGAVVLLHGAAGIGKSQLLATFLREVRSGGGLVLGGRAYEQEGQLPYGPLQEALRDYVTAQTPMLLEGQVAYHAVLVRLLPDLARLLPNLLPSAPLEPKAERHRIFAAFGGLLEDLGRRLPPGSPVVLALEDLHWADVTTLQAVHYLQRTCSAGRVLLVGSYRDEEVEEGSALDQLAARLSSGAQAVGLAVEDLDREGSARMIASLLAPHAVAVELDTMITDRARGNPLFIRELVALLQQSGAVEVRDDIWRLRAGGDLQVPSGIANLFLDRVRQLDEETVRLARLCAVIGQDLHYLLLREASDLQEEALLDGLEALLGAGFLEEAAVRREGTQDRPAYPAYTIHHPLFREALYQQIPIPRRVHLHGRAARALERWHADRAPEHAADLAWQFGRAELHAPAAFYATLAGDQASVAAALPEALAQYLAARTHLAHEPHFEGTPYLPPTLGAVEEKLGDLRLLTGEYVAAQEAFGRARAEAADHARRAELWRKEATSCERRGEFERALTLLDAAEAEGLGPGGLPVAVRATLLLSRCSIHAQRGAYQAASDAALMAVELATLEGDDHTLARAYQLQGNIALQQHDIQGAEAHCRQSLRIWERDSGNLGIQQEIARCWMGLGNVAYLRNARADAESCLHRALALNERIGYTSGVAACWNNLGNVAFAGGDYTAAQERYRRALALWERVGDQYRVGHSWNNLGGVALAQGDLAEASSCFERGLAIQERTGGRSTRGTCWQNLGDVALARGELVQAEERYRRALEILEGTGAQEAIANALIGRAAVARLRGELRPAATLARKARRLALQHQAPGAQAAALLEGARAHLRAGHPRAASIMVDHARALIAARGLVPIAVHAAVLAAELALFRGDLELAATTAAEGTRLAAAGPCRREQAQARYLESCASLAAGERSRAVAALRATREAQRTLGAQLDATRTEVALAAALGGEEAAALLESARSTCRRLGALGELAAAEHLMRSIRCVAPAIPDPPSTSEVAH